MKLAAIKMNLAKVEEGIWIDNIPDMGDLRLKVRPIGNPDYRRVYSQLFKAVPRSQKRGGEVDFDVSQQITARALADTVLLDWDGIEDDNGKPLPYSPETAKKLLLDPELTAFRDAVAWAGNVAADEATGNAEEDAKN